MGVYAINFQPDFVGDLILSIQAAVAARNTEREQLAAAESKDGKAKTPLFVDFLAMKGPDYSIPVGTQGNLARTTLHLEKKAPAVAEGETAVISDELLQVSPYSVHISHQGEEEEGTGQARFHLVFETAQGKLFPKTVTREYVSSTILENKMIKVAMRDRKDALNDVLEFLSTGTAPQ